MEVSVIVLTWNGGSFIEPCLRAVLAQEPPPSEVIVVDNGSTDGTPDLVAERFPAVRLIRNSRNLGFSAGNNIGLRAASGELLVLLNDDTQVHPGFLSALARAFDDPAVGMAGTKLLYPDGTIQHAGGYLYGPRGETEHRGRHSPSDGHFDEVYEPEFVTGAALAIHRRALQQIGLLDEGFSPIYYEDVDWCYRARAAGWRVVFVPQAVVTHHESATADRSSHRHKMNLNHGRVRFVFKHWPADRLLDEFGPAEVSWVAAMPRITELMTARGAYLKVLLDLPGILAFRASSEAEAQALLSLLADLRAAALVSLEALPEAQAVGVVPSPAQPLEPSVRRRPSALGRLFVRFRRLWTGLRYLDVLPDLVSHIQQHDRTLAQHDQALARQAETQAQQGQILRGQTLDVAENVRELSAIAALLARFDAADQVKEHNG
ncbi:MAG: glycosyltransferase family 2 protein [Anaerolineae bacterium]|nr:glycosyltransferase family 2 protein [Anaerolineae bacterium]